MKHDSNDGNDPSSNKNSVGSEYSEIIEALCAVNDVPTFRKNSHKQPLPSREAVIDAVEEFRSILFPGYFGISELEHESFRYHIGAAVARAKKALEAQIKWGLCFDCQEDHDCNIVCDESAKQVASSFIAKLPEVRRLLATDVQAAYEGDPAATSPDETIFCYPGILALIDYRLAHELYLLDVPIIPRIITEHAHSITGIDIHPGTKIGESFFIDHGTGVVIGETSIIGNRVRIYQGVTLGAKSFPLDKDGTPIKGIPRHPIVEDDVIIYSGATILGRVVIGHGSVIGGNVWLTHNVSPGSRITQIEARLEKFESGAGI